MTKKTDYQRSKLYRVERIWWEKYKDQKVDVCNRPTNFDTTAQAQSYACNVWRYYKNKIYPRSWRKDTSLRIKKTSGYKSWAMNTGGWYTNKNGVDYVKIKLSGWHHSAKIVLHEVAHHLAPEGAHHDGRFVKVYMFLLAKDLGYSISYMCKVANEHNLDFHSEDVFLNAWFNKIIQKEIEEEAKKLSA